MVGEKTKKGFNMSPEVRRRVVEVLADPQTEGWPRWRMAKRALVSDTTFREYMTPAVLADVEALKARPFETKALELLDKAILDKALRGDLGAAKLVYARFAGKGDSAPEAEPTLAEIEAIVAALKGHF